MEYKKIYIFFLTLAFIFCKYSQTQKHNLDKWIKLERRNKKRSQTISDNEKYLIDLWIMSECRNCYGDPYDTHYPKHSPLFRDGFHYNKNLDKYKYICKKYKHKPWRKLKNSSSYQN